MISTLPTSTQPSLNDPKATVAVSEHRTRPNGGSSQFGQKPAAKRTTETSPAIADSGLRRKLWLKRQTPQNVVIGGAAGAFPPVIGWVAATGRIGVEPLILFLIIFLWTPPHFWALSLSRAGEYSRAGIPILPVVAGTAETKRQILIYCILLVPISILPCAIGFAGAIYGATAGVSGAMMVLLAVQLCRGSDAEKRPASHLFAFSILYLFVLFAALLADAAMLHSRTA